MAPNFRPQCLKPFPRGQNLQNGNPRVHSAVPTTRRVSHIARLQRRLLSNPYQSKLKEVPPVPLSGPNLVVLGCHVWPLYGSYGVYHCGQGGKAHGSGKKYPNASVPGQLVDPGKRQGYMFPGHPNPSGFVPRVRLGSEPQKSELEPKQVFNFIGYQYDLVKGIVRPTPERWEALNSKINSLLSRTSCSVRQLMSLIGLLTATKKQVPSGRLPRRPIHWYLKNHWHIPKSLEKIIRIPRSLHPHLCWWLKEENVLQGQHLHPLCHAVQIFTDASNEGWGGPI